MTAQIKNPALAGNRGLHQHPYYGVDSTNPNETAARFRQALSDAEREAANGGYIETLNYAEALINAASCSTCAFYASGQCRAQPPRLVTINGQRESVWPPMPPDGWCGSWRSA